MTDKEGWSFFSPDVLDSSKIRKIPSTEPTATSGVGTLKIEKLRSQCFDQPLS